MNTANIYFGVIRVTLVLKRKGTNLNNKYYYLKHVTSLRHMDALSGGNLDTQS